MYEMALGRFLAFISAVFSLICLHVNVRIDGGSGYGRFRDVILKDFRVRQTTLFCA